MKLHVDLVERLVINGELGGEGVRSNGGSGEEERSLFFRERENE